MMKKTINKKLLHSLFSLLLIAGMSSCNMDAVFTKEYTEGTSWSSVQNMELYLNKFYPLIGQTYYSGHINEDAYSDIMMKNDPNSNQMAFALGIRPITPLNNYFDNWGWAYQWIIDCNRFMDGMVRFGEHLPEADRLRAEGEIRFFRAYVYFQLARRYGAEVVLYKDLPDMGVKDRTLSSPEECWNFIEADLDFAIENLPVSPALHGKLSKGAALALKSRSMLYAKRWKSASIAAKAVFDLNIYALHEDYADLFKLRKGNLSKESILDFRFDAPSFAYTFDYFNCPVSDGGYAETVPTENLVSSYQFAYGTNFDWNNPAHVEKPYEGREKRFYASILYNGAAWKGRTLETFKGGVDGITVGQGGTNTGYFMRKLMDEKQEIGKIQKTDLTFHFIRLAEVYLNYAEAMAEQDNLTEALKYLNLVRARAGFTKDLTVGSKSAFTTALRHERMIELAFEGHRFWDLRRWGIAKDVLNDTYIHGARATQAANGFEYERINIRNTKRVYLDKYARFPLPISEIQNNALIEQFDEWK